MKISALAAAVAGVVSTPGLFTKAAVEPSIRKQLAFPMELKTKGEGAFEGYASVFDNVDLGYDVVVKGAFKKKNMVLTKDGHVRVLHQHRTAEPIGKAKCVEDEKGLHFEGQLILSVPEAQKAHELMKEGVLDGMSIGFDILKDEFTDGGIRRLLDLKLWEISVVTFGMNPKARVEGVKAAGQITTIREFEDLLRDAVGYSNSQAKAIAAHGWEGLQLLARDESGAGGDDTKGLLDYLDGIAQRYAPAV